MVNLLSVMQGIWVHHRDVQIYFLWVQNDDLVSADGFDCVRDKIQLERVQSRADSLGGMVNTVLVLKLLVASAEQDERANYYGISFHLQVQRQGSG